MARFNVPQSFLVIDPTTDNKVICIRKYQIINDRLIEKKKIHLELEDSSRLIYQGCFIFCGILYIQTYDRVIKLNPRTLKIFQTDHSDIRYAKLSEKYIIRYPLHRNIPKIAGNKESKNTGLIASFLQYIFGRSANQENKEQIPNFTLLDSEEKVIFTDNRDIFEFSEGKLPFTAIPSLLYVGENIYNIRIEDHSIMYIGRIGQYEYPLRVHQFSKEGLVICTQQQLLVQTDEGFVQIRESMGDEKLIDFFVPKGAETRHVPGFTGNAPDFLFLYTNEDSEIWNYRTQKPFLMESIVVHDTIEIDDRYLQLYVASEDRYLRLKLTEHIFGEGIKDSFLKEYSKITIGEIDTDNRAYLVKIEPTKKFIMKLRNIFITSLKGNLHSNIANIVLKFVNIEL